VKLTAGIALARHPQLTGVQAHPHLDLAGRERLLTLRRGSQRLDWIGKGIQERVSLRVDLDPALGREGSAKEPPVLGECLDVGGLAELVDQPTRALDVREQHGDASGRQLTIGHSNNAHGLQGHSQPDGALPFQGGTRCSGTPLLKPKLQSY
jgi:hypothetical protein